MEQNSDIQNQISSIRELVETLRLKLKELDKEIGKSEIIGGREEKSITSGIVEDKPREKHGHYVTLTERRKRKRTHSFGFTINFSPDFIKEKGLNGNRFLDYDINDKERCLYFSFHEKDTQGTRKKVTGQKDGKHKLSLTLQKQCLWLEDLFRENKGKGNLGNRQFSIKDNIKEGDNAEFPYYISIE